MSLEIKNISKKFINNKISIKGFLKEENIVLNNISAFFKEKNIYIITGDNGSGKTTFLKILTGFLVPCEGEIFLDNSLLNYKKYPYNNFTCIFNYERLYYQLTALENINFFLSIRKLKIEEKLFKKYISILNLNEKNLNMSFANLSQGNKLKINLLLAFLKSSSFFILDEPFSHLDEKTTNNLKDFIKEEKKNKTFIISSLENKNWGDYLFTLKEGKLLKND